MTEDQIKHMVDRFLGWSLPENFKPDAGISFARHWHMNFGGSNRIPSHPLPMPIGTNLFDATQAGAMVRYMIEDLPMNDKIWDDAVAEGKQDEIQRLRAVAWAAQGLMNADTFVSDVPREQAVREATIKLQQALGTWQMHHTASACPLQERGTEAQ